jgi:type I restriction enzyme, S subunit
VGEKWPLIPLGELLRSASRPVTLAPEQTYRVLGARWYAGGLFVKDVKLGAAIQARTAFVVREGDFVYNRLFAWKGSFAVATTSDDGCIVSNEFPCFEARADRLDASYLRLYFTKEAAWNEALGLSSGSTPTSRNRLKEDRLLRMAIPLPSLEEQRRIVVRVESIAAKVEEAQRVRRAAEKEGAALLRSEFARIADGAPRRRLGDVAPLLRRRVRVDLDDAYPEVGVRSFGKGTFHKPALPGAEVGSKKLFEIRSGDLLFNIVFAWEGAIAVATPEDDARVGSHRFLTCVPYPGLATPQFLCFYFLTPEGLAQMGAASPGGAGRNRTLGLKAAAEMRVPVPPLEIQRRFDHLQEFASSVAEQCGLASGEFDALIPSVIDRAFRGEL